MVLEQRNELREHAELSILRKDIQGLENCIPLIIIVLIFNYNISRYVFNNLYFPQGKITINIFKLYF